MTRYRFPDFVTNYDMFGQLMPTFNIRGKSKKQTPAGACCSILILMLTFVFGLLKLEHMLKRKNSAITTLTEGIDDKDSYSLSQDEFMLAVMVEKTLGGEIPYDARYTRWIAERWEYNI